MNIIVATWMPEKKLKLWLDEMSKEWPRNADFPKNACDCQDIAKPVLREIKFYEIYMHDLYADQFKEAMSSWFSDAGMLKPLLKPFSWLFNLKWRFSRERPTDYKKAPLKIFDPKDWNWTRRAGRGGMMGARNMILLVKEDEMTSSTAKPCPACGKNIYSTHL